MRTIARPHIQSGRLRPAPRQQSGRKKLGRDVLPSRKRVADKGTDEQIATIVAVARAKPKRVQKLFKAPFAPEEPLLHFVLTGLTLVLLSQFWWQIKMFANMEQKYVLFDPDS